MEQLPKQTRGLITSQFSSQRRTKLGGGGGVIKDKGLHLWGEEKRRKLKKNTVSMGQGDWWAERKKRLHHASGGEKNSKKKNGKKEGYTLGGGCTKGGRVSHQGKGQRARLKGTGKYQKKKTGGSRPGNSTPWVSWGEGVEWFQERGLSDQPTRGGVYKIMQGPR